MQAKFRLTGISKSLVWPSFKFLQLCTVALTVASPDTLPAREGLLWFLQSKTRSLRADLNSLALSPRYALHPHIALCTCRWRSQTLFFIAGVGSRTNRTRQPRGGPTKSPQPPQHHQLHTATATYHVSTFATQPPQRTSHSKAHRRPTSKATGTAEPHHAKPAIQLTGEQRLWAG